MRKRHTTIVFLHRYHPSKDFYDETIEFELENPPDIQLHDTLFLPIFGGVGFRLTGRRWDKDKDGKVSLTLRFEEKVAISDSVWEHIVKQGERIAGYRGASYLPKQRFY